MDYFLPSVRIAEKRLAIFHRVPVFDENPGHFPGHIRLNFVHQLHGFDDAQHLAGFDPLPDCHERLRARTRRGVERAHDRRLHHMKTFFRRPWRSGCRRGLARISGCRHGFAQWVRVPASGQRSIPAADRRSTRPRVAAFFSTM